MRLHGDMPGATRVEAGRRRAKAAKRAVALTAAAGFAVVLALVRQGAQRPARFRPTPCRSRRGAPLPPSPGRAAPNSAVQLGGGSLAPSSGGGPLCFQPHVVNGIDWYTARAAGVVAYAHPERQAFACAGAALTLLSSCRAVGQPPAAMSS